MRRIVALAWLLLLAGCSSTSPSSLFGGGVGNSVYSADIAKESALQEIYSGILCQDNGLPTYGGADGAPRCAYDQMDSDRWGLFVNAGIYDIDRRCDAYLQWLYEMKNAKEPMIAQLTKTGSLAATLLKAFNASNLTIDLAAAAFGYAADTFTNFDPNLLFGVESSTIQTIVLTRQKDAKTQIHGLRFGNKPEAMHALRGYLRVCMPFTIQTDINTTLASHARGDASPERVVDITQDTTGALQATDPVVYQPGTFTDEDAADMFVDPTNKNSTDVKKVQRILCDPNPGGVGDYTRFLIAVVEDNPDFSGFRRDGKLNTAEYNYVLSLRTDCDTSLYRNSYEREILSDPADFGLIVQNINKLLPNPPIPEDVPYTDASYPRATFRAKLAELRASQTITVDYKVPNEQLTKSLRIALLVAANS